MVSAKTVRSKRILKISIGGKIFIVGCIAMYTMTLIVVLTYPKKVLVEGIVEPSVSNQSTAKKHRVRDRRQTPDTNSYQVIVTNNLFRPLVWTKPKLASAFELIATVMKRNGKHKVLIRSAKNGRMYYSAVGELAGEAMVEKVERHSVTLNENGVSKVYRLKL